MYLSGFGNHHQTEAIAGALPTFQNSPQKCPLGLYAEQISGSAFTRPRHMNLHTWMYRQLPSVVHNDFLPFTNKNIHESYAPIQSPNPLRWAALEKPTTEKDFIHGLSHIAGNDNLNTYIFQCNKSMTSEYFSNRDGELLFVPYQGRIELQTELGLLEIEAGMIAVIPRGIYFKIILKDDYAAGYLCENLKSPLTLPQLGLIGANGLANPRHFFYPKAAVEAKPSKKVTLICKYQHNLFYAEQKHSPFNVVAWHGNYAPYAYDLSLFNTINTVSFDHPDPSIFTVLTSESETNGVANLDFVIFPARWMVAKDTFRPPYFHRNIMSELMGLIKGEYDAKSSGFEIGGLSIHNCMTPHGPDTKSYHQATIQHLQPNYYDNTLAFMFETNHPWLVTESAFNSKCRQKNYTDCWQGLS